MAAKPGLRNWKDVQTAIATAAIVSTLGLWNLFATPLKKEISATSQPPVPPTEPPVSSALTPTPMPQVKIMFTQATPQTTIVQQIQQQIQNTKKKKNRNNDPSNGGSVTQTKTS